jgi:excisionase family DNA binding protein
MDAGDQGVDEMLTVEELCSWFKVSKDWVYDEVEARRLPYVRLGRRHLRFRRGELEQYLNARTLRPTDQFEIQQ